MEASNRSSMKPHLLRSSTTESEEFYEAAEQGGSEPPQSSILHPPSASQRKVSAGRERRRRKLDSLRRRMKSEEEGVEDEFMEASEGMGEVERQRGGEEEEISLASWGKGLLNTNQRVPTATAADSLSTKGAASAQPDPSAKTSTGGSSGSSKSATLERYVSALETLPSSSIGSKSSSLERAEAARIRSLSRDASLSETLEDRRKNSEAAEIIDALTCEVVGAGLSCSSSRRESAGPSLLHPKSASLERPISLALEPVDKAALKAALNGRQPDVVASAVKSSSGSNIAEAKAKAMPVPPPRKTKAHSAALPPPPPLSNPHSSSAPSSARSHTYSGHSSVSVTNLNHFRQAGAQATGTGMGTGTRTSAEEGSGRSKPLDPLSLEAQRRMSHKFPSLVGDGCSIASSSALSSSSSVSTGDATSLASLPTHNRSYIRHASVRAKQMKAALGRHVGRKMWATVGGVKKVADEVWERGRGGEGGESTASEEEPEEAEGIPGNGPARPLRVRSRHHKKGPFDFEGLRQVQELSGDQSGAIWCLKFSHCGRLLATAGQDSIIRLWVLRSAHATFAHMRAKYEADPNPGDLLQNLGKVPTEEKRSGGGGGGLEEAAEGDVDGEDLFAPFLRKPLATYRGHNADVLNVCWSKAYFLLSSSVDKTVRLWHVSRTECLCVFQHIDFVTSIAFLQDDKFFISGSFDGKLRVWSITEKKVALWNELEGGRFITALAFVNNGAYVVAGTFDGKCVFYTSDQLKYHTMIHVKSSRGKNARPHKVTGLAVFPDRSRGDKLLVTTNDSRIRLYDLNNLSLQCKYKGLTNNESQIAASFSPDGKHIICGSEDRYFYLWRTAMDSATLGVRKDRNGSWEKVRAHQAVVTASAFAPRPALIFKALDSSKAALGHAPSAASQPPSPNLSQAQAQGDVIVTGDFAGAICVFLNRSKPLRAGASTFFAQ